MSYSGRFSIAIAPLNRDIYIHDTINNGIEIANGLVDWRIESRPGGLHWISIANRYISSDNFTGDFGLLVLRAGIGEAVEFRITENDNHTVNITYRDAANRERALAVNATVVGTRIRGEYVPAANSTWELAPA